MFIAYAVIAILLAIGLIASGYGKLSRNERIVTGLTGIGVPLGLFPFLAACEIAGAAGLLIGLWYAPLGIAAAVGVVLYFVGALGTHLVKGDFKGMPNALIMFVPAVAALVLRLASL
ncbi:DoxX family protein [Nonomuraea sp. NPDC049695]|uniref:DoxX family protein n=1 Tax=Nonomuraea sp. NPDC049695 TaxID=3154734 RepID=UPI0034202523